jgi:ABC-type transport system involved in cytochrome bd biosynthesis fused ATPase/permease subunit
LDNKFLGKVSSATLTAFLVFIILVWLSTAIGRVLAGLLPQIPAPVRAIMDPETTEHTGDVFAR